MKYMYLKMILIFTVLFVIMGCHEETAEERNQDVVQEQQDQYAKAQPIPKFEFSLERDITIQLYQARNENVATHTVWRSDMGIVEGDCSSIGFPLPYDTSLTNPLQLTVVKKQHNEFVEGAIEQAEPNGIFASKNSTATWVRCVLPDGHEVPVYIESKVTAYPYPVTVDYDTNRVLRDGNSKPSVTIKNTAR